ncbi:hypothetical protein A3A46_00960 [Candidatus Roizmanbacteria bacterium RIFCSPLOWO2_01_FULL_37_13]|uniref:Uncharacterized protein n=1 Tax=Candidatus Roizmanbacteria bacterium RIFCSPHIGHO2_02_FULL_38_11 TaxID=1802039 RepID=A0A1F7H1A6_9BACT|nr:MAG: hypothetical protein A3C25_02770 [Candidatus Roizmanbacteria bacterium RIFCSPHIGHO2_02_FULL_38_11]OGK41257.1 MAG: hypothetical protein A3A46_00960 [Candidatus Roizmanbacteria bacterium RIFCSPLOWO2_01_FULL_37_13]
MPNPASPAEIKAGYANLPLQIVRSITKSFIDQGGGILEEIRAPANAYFTQLRRPGVNLQMALELFVKPIDTTGVPVKERELMVPLMGRQSLALAALATASNKEYRDVYDFKLDSDSRETFRLLLDKALLFDYACHQSLADQAILYNDLESAGQHQAEANQVLEFRKRLLEKASPTEEAPNPGQ